MLLFTCKKQKTPENPFDDPSLQAPNTGSAYSPGPESFEYLYHNVFNPTCANSNCHDGTFQPDFRTISSSYNSLVYAPIILNPVGSPYNYRVLPGNANLSMLKHRLTQMPGAGPGTLGQGRMPFVDTNYLYSSAGSGYVQKIIDWINNGAKDIYGNAPTLGNKNPNTLGFQICNAGSLTAKTRNKYFEISKSNGPIDFWFYITDDATAPADMTLAEVKLSKYKYDFSAATTLPLSYVASGPSYKEMTSPSNVTYSYKLNNYNLSAVQPDTGYIFVRTYFKDLDHAVPAETPNNGSVYYTDYFIIKITP